MEMDDEYFLKQADGAKIAGFSFHEDDRKTHKGFVPPKSEEGRPSELVYMNNWSRETST